MTSPLPDAAPSNWVDRFAPAPLRPWLQLGRFDRPVGIWLLMLPGWWGLALASARSGRVPDLWLLVLFFVGAAVMRAAGCAYNDMVDRDLDRKVARTAERPVASGRISRKAALAYAVGLSFVGLVVLLQLNRLAQLIGLASLLLVAAYPFMKRITWWPQAWLGLTFNWGVLVGYAAVSGELPLPALLLYAAGVFWTVGYDTIYALQDIEDDALAGVKSSARRLGARTRQGVLLFYIGAIALVLAAGSSAGLGAGFFVGLAVFGIHLVRQARRLRVDNPVLALSLFKSNLTAGLILFGALMLGVV